MSFDVLMCFTISIFGVLLTPTLSQRSGYFSDANEPDGNSTRNCSVCGISHPEGRIINGTAVDPVNRYPWMVALKNIREEVRCGGAILSEWYILTAAHCLYSVKVEDLRIVFTSKEGAIVAEGVPVERIIQHPDWDLTIAYDISLIKMRDPITCNDFASPLCLPPSGLEIQPGWRTAYRISGWGRTNEGKKPQELLEGRIQVVPMEECNLLRTKDDPFQNLSYCCKAYDNTGPCSGDSGGSMFTRYGSKFFSLGIASTHSDGSCDLSSPFIYTSVPKFMDWISQETGLKPEPINPDQLPSGTRSPKRRRRKHKRQKKSLS